jgi:hypothetical protein
VFLEIRRTLRVAGNLQAPNREVKGGDARERTATAEPEFQVLFENDRTNKMRGFYNEAEDGAILY